MFIQLANELGYHYICLVNRDITGNTAQVCRLDNIAFKDMASAFDFLCGLYSRSNIEHGTAPKHKELVSASGGSFILARTSSITYASNYSPLPKEDRQRMFGGALYVMD